MPVATCPSREDLMDYAVGKLADHALNSLAGHLDSCPHCQAELAMLPEPDDTLVARLRGPVSAEPFIEETGFGQAMSRAMAVMGKGSPAADLPRQMGEYQLLERLRGGGMGTVYKARQGRLDRIVALKVLSVGRTGNPQAAVRFEREMKAIGRLDHPNIVRAYDAREIEATPVLVMEFVEGLDLAEIVRRVGRISSPDACELICQTALALQCAHEHGLVHRDIKPSNIMLARSGMVKLLDLGLARFFAEDRADAAEEMTGTGQAIGTADYMAPEQASDSRAVDIRADIYSLGCTLYKLLAGRAPFSGAEYRTTLDKLNAHVHEPAPSIRQLAPDVPEEVAEVLGRMLSKDPQNRFTAPAEVVEALAPWCAGADLRALVARAEIATGVPLPPGEGSGGGDGSGNGRSEGPSRERQPVTRPPLLLASWGWKWFVGQLILLLMAGGLGFALGVIITVKKNGHTQQVEVPDDSKTVVDSSGNITVEMPGTSKVGSPQPPTSTAPPAGTGRANLLAEIQRIAFKVTFEDDNPAKPVIGVDFRERQVTDDLLEHIKGLTELKSLSLSSALSPRGSSLEPLRGLSQLQSLDLSQNRWLTNARLECLKGLRTLQSLDLSDTSLTNAGLEHVRALTKLQSLALSGTKVTDAGLEHLKDMSALQSLDLTRTGITGAGLKYLKGMSNLRSLKLSGPLVTDAGMEQLEGLAKLQSLYLWNTNVTDAALKDLRGLTNLESLELERTGITDAGLEFIRGLSNLQVLDLQATKVTDAGLKHIKGLSKLQSLVLAQTGVTDAGLECLKGLTNLRTLDLLGTNLTGPGLVNLKDLSQLQSLSVTSTSTGLTDEGPKYLQGLSQLRSLRLHSNAITDKGLEPLKRLTNLEVLELGCAKVTDVGLEHIRGLTNLKELRLPFPKVTDGGLKYLEKLKNLHILNLNCSGVTDDGLEHLKGLTNLKQLGLIGTNVTDAAVANLQDALPTCSIATPRDAQGVTRGMRGTLRTRLGVRQGPAAAALPLVTVARPVLRDVSEYEDYTGRIEKAVAPIVMPVDGTIENVHFKQGMAVQQGDVLFEVTSNRDLNKIALATGREREASEQLARAKKKSPKDDKQIDEAGKEWKAAHEQLNRVQSDVQRVKVLASLPGSVNLANPYDLDANSLVGYSNANAQFGTITSSDSMYAIFDVDERTVLSHRRMANRKPDWGPSLPVLCGLADGEGYPYRGKVVSLANEIDPKTGTQRWKALIPNKDGILLPGMFVRVRLITSEPHKALLVPEIAVMAHPDQTFVLVVKDQNLVERRNVEVGQSHDGLRVVTEGVKAGDWVITSNSREVQVGMAVRPEKAAATPSAPAPASSSGSTPATPGTAQPINTPPAVSAQPARPDPPTKITPEEFARLTEHQKKAALLDGIRRIQRTCANISLKTASHVSKKDGHGKEKGAIMIMDDLGSYTYQLKRINKSFQLAVAEYRPGRNETECSTSQYSAESGVMRDVFVTRLLDGSEQTNAHIYKTDNPSCGTECRYTSYLGGLPFLGFPESDFFQFVLDHAAVLKIRAIDPRSRLVEAGFNYTDEQRKKTGSCSVWLDLGKDWMLRRRVAEWKNTTGNNYERFEVLESEQFDGVWMPTLFTEVMALSGERWKTPVGNFVRITAENIKIGSVKKEDIETVFPAGTLVNDEITGDRYVAGRPGEKLPYHGTP